MYSLAVRFSRSFISQNGLFSFAVTRLRFSNLSFTKLNSILDVQVHRMNLGPRELTDAVDLLSHFNLQQHYAFFFFLQEVTTRLVNFRQPLPSPCGWRHRNQKKDVEGMQLARLIQDTPPSRESNVQILTFDLDAP